MYFSKDLFFKLCSQWFEELKNREGLEKRVAILRKNFWKSFLLSFIVIGSTALYLVEAGHAEADKSFCLRLVAIIIALNASLGRGGWNIQSFKGKTVIERIDRGMFILSQLGATVILLFALTLK